MTAKAVVIAATGLIVGGVATLFSYVLGNAILTSRDMELVLKEHPGPCAGRRGPPFALYGLVGLGLGAIIRATAGAITLLRVWLIVESIISGFFPKVGRWLPFTAGSQLMSTSSTFDAEALTPRAGGLLFALFALVLLLVGSTLVVRRDDST